MQMGRSQRLLRRQGQKASARIFKPNRNLGLEDLEPIGSTKSSKFQRKLALRSNPQSFKLNQPQIVIPQRQQLLRRVSRFRHRPPPRQGYRSIGEQNFRRLTVVAAKSPAALRPILARQPFHRNNPGFEPNRTKVPERVQQPAFRRDPGDSDIGPFQCVVVFRQPGTLRRTDSKGMQKQQYFAAVD